MSELKITGSPTPIVGKEEFYSANQLLPSPLPFQNLNNSATNPFEQPVEWSVHVLENAKWVQKEENDKTGNKVSYKFTQKSLERNGIRILAKRGNQVARLNIKPHKAESPKIDSIEFLDKNGNKPTKPFAYGQTLKARVHCLHMENRKVYATLWEDDAAGAGHDKANEKNKMKTLPGIVKGGIADIDFVLEPDFAKIANAIKAKGDSDEGKTHEYYVTAEILNKKTASKNTNVANPDDKAATTKPAAPKKETPAQKKGPSKKQEKEKEKEKSIGDGIIDWWEGLFKVKPIVAPNPEAPTGNNPLKTGEPDNPKEDKKDNKKSACPNCDKDITLDEIEKMFGVIPKYKVFRQEIVKYLNEYVKLSKKNGKPIHLDTCLRKAHFFAQVGTETLGINPDWMVETDSVRYNVSNCKAVFGQRAKTLEKEGLLDDYCSDNPQKRLLNYIYASENGFGNGNGNEASGDGYKFRGRGLKQLTGRGNYKDITKILKEVFPDEYIDLETNPDKVKEPKYAVLTALAFWEKHEIWKVADTIKESTNENVKKIRKKVNPGLAGWKECKTYFEKGLKAFKLSECKKDKVGSDSEENEVKLHFTGATANESALSAKTKKLLKEVGKASSNYNIYITSIARTPHDQARIMYTNCAKNLSEQRNTYKAPGQKVIDVYENETKNGKSKEKIIEMMENKINELGPSTVSKHLANPDVLNTFDIAYELLSDKTKFFNEMKKRNELDDILVENKCYHIQIKQ